MCFYKRTVPLVSWFQGCGRGIKEMKLPHARPRSDIRAITELLYLIIVALYVLKQSFDGTMFYIPWPQNYEYILRIAACAVIFIRLGYTNAYSGSEWFICILTGTAFGFSWISTGYDFLLDIALLTAGAVGISHRKILKAGFWTVLYVLLLAMLGSFAGCIPDLIYHQTGASFRHSFGIVYSTDFAAHVMFLVLAGWVLYGGTCAPLFACCALGLAAYTYYYCQAKCSAIILVLCALSAMYVSLMERYSGKSRPLYRLSKGVDAMLTWVMPVCAVLIIGLTYLYDYNVAWKENLNLFLSHRLRLGKRAMDNYGIKWFGTAFDQLGYGGTTVWPSAYAYNFVDSSYVLILLRYGAASLLMLCARYIWMERKALRNGCRRLAFAAALVAVHSVIEHHLPEICYNLFLLLPFADCVQDAKTEQVRASKHFRIIIYAVALTAGGALALVLPGTVTYLKTIVGLLQWDAPENMLKFIGVVAVGLSAVCLILRILTRIIINAAGNKAGGRVLFTPKQLLALGVAFTLLLTEFLYFERTIGQGRQEYAHVLAADSSVIGEITASKETTDGLYIDVLPELYMREFDGIRHMVISAEGLAPRAGTTLITADEGELHTLIEAGYAYGTLPSGNAVYTNSGSAKKILEREGIALTGYYSKVKKVDLAKTALLNNLTLTERNTLRLDGYEKSLWHGLGVTVYSGTLRVEYRLRLMDCAISEGAVATIRISSDWGATVWNQMDIAMEDFDENKECSYVIDTNLAIDCSNMEFLLIVPDGVQMEIEEINYGKVG